MTDSGVSSTIPAALVAVALLWTAPTLAQGRVLPDPAQPVAGFKPHELPFELPRDGVARTEYRSASFYAVILKTTKRCSVTENDRLEAQALFPRNKVFSTRFECGNGGEENITYTNVDAAFGFIAAYAGDTSDQARAFLDRVKASGRYPGAIPAGWKPCSSITEIVPEHRMPYPLLIGLLLWTAAKIDALQIGVKSR